MVGPIKIGHFAARMAFALAIFAAYVQISPAIDFDYVTIGNSEHHVGVRVQASQISSRQRLTVTKLNTSTTYLALGTLMWRLVKPGNVLASLFPTVTSLAAVPLQEPLRI